MPQVVPTPLSRALAKGRKALKTTPEQLAKAIKRDPGQVLRYESGAARPSPPVLHLETVCRVLPGLSSAWLAGGAVPALIRPEKAPEVVQRTPMAAVVAALYGEGVTPVPSTKPKPSKKLSGVRHPNALGPRVKEVLEVSVFDQCSLTGDFTIGELSECLPSNLSKMAGVLRHYANWVNRGS